jgi:hypothetical protein
MGRVRFRERRGCFSASGPRQRGAVVDLGPDHDGAARRSHVSCWSQRASGFAGIAAAVAPTRGIRARSRAWVRAGSRWGRVGARGCGVKAPRKSPSVPRSVRSRGTVLDPGPKHDSRLVAVSRLLDGSAVRASNRSGPFVSGSAAQCSAVAHIAPAAAVADERVFPACVNDHMPFPALTLRAQLSVRLWPFSNHASHFERKFSGLLPFPLR